MNICFLAGKIISEIEFRFILTGKNYCAVKFTLELFDGTFVNLLGYDDVADYSYRKMKNGDVIFCEAVLGEKDVVVDYVELVQGG